MSPVPLRGGEPVDPLDEVPEADAFEQATAMDEDVDGQDSDDGDYSGLFGRRFASNGAPLGGEFQINTYTPYRQRSGDVAVEADGDFVVVWQSFQDGGYYDGIFGQRFDSAGTRIGSEFQVNTYTPFDQRSPAVTVADDGRFVVVWESYRQDSSEEGVFGQVFAANGIPEGSEFQVNTFFYGYQDNPQICSSADGSSGGAWRRPSGS